jgi:hypothetical protein
MGSALQGGCEARRITHLNRHTRCMHCAQGNGPPPECSRDTMSHFAQSTRTQHVLFSIIVGRSARYGPIASKGNFGSLRSFLNRITTDHMESSFTPASENRPVVEFALLQDINHDISQPRPEEVKTGLHKRAGLAAWPEILHPACPQQAQTSIDTFPSAEIGNSQLTLCPRQITRVRVRAMYRARRVDRARESHASRKSWSGVSVACRHGLLAVVC